MLFIACLCLMVMVLEAKQECNKDNDNFKNLFALGFNSALSGTLIGGGYGLLGTDLINSSPESRRP